MNVFAFLHMVHIRNTLAHVKYYFMKPLVLHNMTFYSHRGIMHRVGRNVPTGYTAWTFKNVYIFTCFV